MEAAPESAAQAWEQAEIEEDEAILAAVKAGQGASHEAVRRWLLSKDTPNPLPRPKPGD